jgi:hypothetical protein
LKALLFCWTKAVGTEPGVTNAETPPKQRAAESKALMDFIWNDYLI